MFTKTFPSNHPECRITEFIRQANECDFFIKIPEAAYEYEIKNAFIILITNFAVWTQLTFFSFCPVNINFIKITLFVSLAAVVISVCFLHYGGKRVFCFRRTAALPVPKANEKSDWEFVWGMERCFFLFFCFCLCRHCFFIKTPYGARQTCQTFIDIPHSSSSICVPPSINIYWAIQSRNSRSQSWQFRSNAFCLIFFQFFFPWIM